ncbi:ABC transporter permease [Pluralibacter gergoviae]|nr:ABC transporter permease [Pluralibacter gergoviae]ELC3017047.1 ABC transporter permease [Pluralibacter gergoviae]ELC3021547.1 ABC transporter permease [Pluralibacter gergoviae]
MKRDAAPLIALNGIWRHFPSGGEQVAVLKDISLTVREGEMVAIIGASGSGKSTLMNIIGCLDTPTRGEMRIHGVATHAADSGQLAKLRSQYIGFIFQRYHLMPWLSAAENVAIPALYTAMPAAERRARAAYLLQRLGLGQRLDYRPAQLSGGQQQRVSISRALMNGASIILADEPTGALDRASGQALMHILHELHEAGHTIIIVTHDRDIASQAARIIEISDGEIVADRPNAAQKAARAPGQLPRVAVNARPPFWQSLIEAVRMAWRSLLGHRTRAFLSMLGIIIGISSVVSSMAVGEGARQSIMAEIGKLGNSTLEVRPGREMGRVAPEYINALSAADVALLQQQPWIDSVSPVVSKTAMAIRGSMPAAAIQLSGVNDDFFRVQGVNVIRGAVLTRPDVENREPAIVIDPLTESILFEPGEDPVGEVILLSGVPFRVVGVASKKGPKMLGGLMGGWIPYTSLTQRMTGSMPIESLTLRFHDGVSLGEAQRRVERLLAQAHERRDFYTQTDDQLAKALQKTSDSMSMLITAIAAISLLVGGVGVMNIMLVSVTERTHEIGIRLSVGARPGDIMMQFLIEAIAICALGGLLGIVGSWISGLVFAQFTREFSMVFTPGPVLLSCGFSALIGLCFGFFPARNAARLNPTEALARE